ncbi:MAG: glycosyltransferase family 4 protein [Candidatus Azambacteria bacterium]|nr:glycosyltransferase family 4 protein [Candidatus Azambacteria bacterium]
MKKILFVITKSEIGGAQKYVLDLARGANENGFEVSVASEHNGYFYETLTEAGIPFHEIKSVQRAINIWQDVKLFFELLSLIRKEKPDVLHLNSSKIGAVGGIAGKLARVPKIIFTAHGWAFNEHRSPLQKKIIVLLSRFAALFQDTIICVSEYDKNGALAHHIAPLKKLVTIHNGIDSAVTTKRLLSRKEAREKLGIKEDAFIVGTIANFYKNKALDALAFAAISAAHSDVHFVIIGDGPEREKTERLIEKYQLTERFTLTGALQDANIYLKAFDIFVLPSRKEGLPYALLEAMAAKLICIASDVGGIPEVIENGKNGITIKHITPGKLWESIETCSKSKKHCRELAALGAETIQEKFSLQEMVRGTLGLYQ